MKKNLANIFITGGAGFIGSEFVRQVYENKSIDKIFILDNLTYAADLNRIEFELKNSKVVFLEEDINNANIFKSELNSCAYLIHFAAETHVDRSISDGSPFIETNVKGTHALLEAAKINPELRILIVSTDEVYGSISNGEASESAILNPSSVYSASKAAADLIALAAISTFKQKIIITRCCNNYGLFQNSEKLIPNMISSIINGNDINLYGDGQNIREWIHVKDHVSALWKVLTLGRIGEIYNIGTGQRYTNLVIAKFVLEHLSLPESRIRFVEDRKGHDSRYSLDSKKIEKELGWRFELDFFSNLSLLVDEYSEKRLN